MMGAMKPSGIDWIGEIPSDWSLEKIRFATTVRTEVGKYTPDDVFIGLENVESSSGRLIQTESEYEEGVYDIFCKGDVLFSKLRPYLEKAFIADFDGFCTGEFVIFKGFDGDKRFLFYFLLSHGFIEIVNASTYGAKMPRASWDYIKNLQMPLPCATEQRAIAAFLDDRCGYIDSIVADLEQQVEILRQYKKALITETVTKGLDKSAPMKAVGFDVVDKMPESWQKTKIKYLCNMQSGTAITSDEITEDDEYPVYGGNGLRGYYEKYNTNGEYVLVGRQGALCGNVHFVNGKFWASDHAVVTYPYSNVVNKFLYYLFIALNFNQYSTTAAQPGLAVTTIQRVSVAVPPTKNEQTDIVNYLDEKCAETDALIAEKQRSVETMRQYKRSLIYEYVTGKKRVAS